ncbi:MAG: hypothetical protein V4489_08910 [Chlamydiota bacterium]
MNSVCKTLVSKALNCNIKNIVNNNHFENGYKNLQIGLQRFQDVKFEFLKSQGYEVVRLSENQLKVGYESLRKRISEISITIGVSASLSTIFSGVWLAISGSPLLESPTPMIALAVGGGVVINQVTEAYHIKKYAKLSVLSNPIGPAISNELNGKIQQIIAGVNPTVKLTSSGLEIIGPIGNLDHPSLVRENTLSQIRSMKKIILPTCVLGKHVDPLVGNIRKCWVSCLTLPFSFFSIMAALNKSSKNRSVADYIFAGAGTYNIHNYFYGESIGEVRKKFSLHLEKGKTPEELLKLIVDGNDLQEGMSFLHPWAKDANTLGVKMDWMGRLIIYKNPSKNSFSLSEGAYPIQEFPRENVTYEGEENKEGKLLCALGAFTLAGIAGVILGAKKKVSVTS